jgi:thioredoxin-related protein
MNKLHLLLTCFAVACLTSSCGPEKPEIVTESQSPAAPAAQATEGWLTDFDAAKKQASESNKLVLINFTGSDWCPPCIMLRREVFSRPEFAEYARQHLVLLEVDFPRRKTQSRELVIANQQLLRQFGVEGFPTIVVVNAEGKTVGALGYMPGGAERFIGELEKIRAL